MPSCIRIIHVIVLVLAILLSSSQEGMSFQIQSLQTKKHHQGTRRTIVMTWSLKAKPENNDNNDNFHPPFFTSRRSLLYKSSLLGLSTIFQPIPAQAGLVQFPCNYDLMNTYHLMRAGESLLESQDIISTNPLFLTNREDALSITGIEQVEATCVNMMDHDVNPSVIKYSLAAKSIDTANIIATQLQVRFHNSIFS